MRPGGKGVLVLDNITKKYELGDATVSALGGVSMSIKSGERASIMGPSGSGKSTLLHMLGLLDNPTSGAIYIDGVSTSNMEDAALAKFRGSKIGFVFQSFHLIPTLSALENVMLPMAFLGIEIDERKKRARKTLEKLGMEDRVNHLPGQLSGGQRQRVAIARALVNNPSILLADEPTGNLDSKSGAAVLDIFNKLHAEGMTIVTVTHDSGIARMSQRIFHIKDGLLEKIEVRR